MLFTVTTSLQECEQSGLQRNRAEWMKATRAHEFGGPEVLKFEEVPTPKASAGELLVRIHAAGVNPYDIYMRAGTYPVKPTLP
jgi:NADPH:quinone reductase-like Zn-dependent oxidoreductase